MNKIRFKSALSGLKFSALIWLGLLLAGCFSANEEQVSAGKELLTTPALPEDTLLQNATEAYDRGLYSLSKDSWAQLRDGYPAGPYALLAELKIADASFFSGDYPGAVGAYEEFLRLHPQNEAAPYVQYQIGRSYQEQSRGDDRDPTPMKQALNAYEQVLSRYPNSGYAVSAGQKIAECDSALEAHERLIAEFYERTGQTKAAEKRYSDIAAQKREAKARRSTKKIEEQTILGSTSQISAEDLPEGAEAQLESGGDGLLELTAEGTPIIPIEKPPVEQKIAAGAGALRPPPAPQPVAVDVSGADGAIAVVPNQLLADLRCEQIAGTPVVTLLYRSDIFSSGRRLPRWSVVDQGSSAAKAERIGQPRTLNKQLALPTGGIRGLAAQQLKCEVDGTVRISASVQPQNGAKDQPLALMTLAFPSSLTPVLVPLDRPYRLLLLFRSTAAAQKTPDQTDTAQVEF